MSTDIERHAIAAGWSRDGDGWWVRPLRKGDPDVEAFIVNGDEKFFTDEDGVYCRTASAALAFDRASR